MLFLCLRVGNQPISLRASAKRRWQLWSQMYGLDMFGHIKRHLTAPFQSISISKLGVKNGKTPGRHVQAGWQKTFDWAWLVKIVVKALQG